MHPAAVRSGVGFRRGGPHLPSLPVHRDHATRHDRLHDRLRRLAPPSHPAGPRRRSRTRRPRRRHHSRSGLRTQSVSLGLHFELGRSGARRTLDSEYFGEVWVMMRSPATRRRRSVGSFGLVVLVCAWLALSTPAASAAITHVNCGTGGNLQTAITNAHGGSTIL